LAADDKEEEEEEEKNKSDTASWGMYVHIHRRNEIHHSTIFAGGPVDFAGEIRANRGRIVWISNKSGHYKPGREAILEMLHHLAVRGVRLSSFAFDVVRDSVCLDALRKFCRPETIDRGTASYWRVSDARVLYEGLLTRRWWDRDFDAFLTSRFGRVSAGLVVRNAWRRRRSFCVWTDCMRGLKRLAIRSNVESVVVERGMLAVESYEAKIIEKGRLQEQLRGISFSCIRTYAGGDLGILGAVRSEDEQRRPLRWYYRRVRGGRTSGPHKSSSIYLWIRRDMLPTDAMLSCHETGPYVAVSELCARFVNFVAIRDLLLRR